MPVYQMRSIAYYIGAILVCCIIILLTYSSYSGTPRTLIDQAKQSLRHDILGDVSNATLGFEKIFVINLAHRTDHRDAMTLAASVTGLQFEFVDGVTEVSSKVWPPGNASTMLNKGEAGNWRAHMNVAQRMIQQNIASALILEDDVDWDLRVKQQMLDFAKASQLLVQPLPGTKDQMLDPTYPQPTSMSEQHTDFYIDRDRTTRSKISPYGDLDRWDMLWFGHCGTYFPGAANINRPLGRVPILHDQTVPEPQHVGFLFGNDTLLKDYPPHTRVVSRANRNICTFGYGLSLPGARRLLYELGIHRLDEPTDIEMRSFCDGDGRPVASCLTVQPELFQHHRPVGLSASLSDIGFHGSGENKQAFTRNIRWSTRLNMQKLMNGETDYIDLFKDGEPFVDYGWG